MAQERICMMCGKKTKYCPTCRDSKPAETWRMLFHDEKCLEISEIWYAYRGKEITKEDARRRMDRIKPNIDDILKNDSIAAKEIKEIFGIEEEKQEEIKEEKKAVDDKTPEVNVTPAKDNEKKSFNYKKK